MNIKSKQLRFLSIAAATVFFSLGLSFTFAPTTHAADAPLQQVTDYCKKKAKKASSACPLAAQQSINKASYNCKKSSDKNKCLVTKAKKYIDAGAKGNPATDKFKDQLKKKFDSIKTGNPDTMDTSIYALAEGASFFGGKEGKYQCGGDDTNVVTTKIDFGCLGPDDAPEDMNPIIDLALAIIRFMSAGVGLIVVASIIYAGIQYSSSEGNAEATTASKARVRNSLIGLLIYIFGFSMIQFLVPGGIFAP